MEAAKNAIIGLKTLNFLSLYVRAIKGIIGFCQILCLRWR